MISKQEFEEIGKVIEHMDTFFNEDGPQLEKLDVDLVIYNYNRTIALGVVSFDTDPEQGDPEWNFTPWTQRGKRSPE